MATRDMFLSALEMSTRDMEAQRRAARAIHEQAKELEEARSAVPIAPPAGPRVPVPPPPAQPADSNQAALKGPRPDFADDIDLIVQAMVNVGMVVLDAETDTYRKPDDRKRAWRFGYSE